MHKRQAPPAPEREFERVVEVGHESEGCVLATYGDILLGYWQVSANASHVAPLRTQFHQVARSFGKVSALHVMTGSSPMPEPDARSSLNALTQELSAATLATSVALIGKGFWASALRSVIMSHQWLMSDRKDSRIHIGGSIAESAAWLAATHSAATGRFVAATSLQTAVASLAEIPQLRRVVHD